MKRTKIILITILINIVLFSCSPDDNSEQPKNKLVKSEKVSESLKINYIYNNKGILSSATGTYPNFGYISNFTYDSNDKITKSSFQETGSSTYSDTQNFNYDSQGRLISYSANTENVNIEYNGNIVTLTGTIEGNSNSEAKLELNSNGLISKFTESNQYTNFEYDSNGNMIVAKSYNNNNNLIREFAISYDTKINPFYGQSSSIYIERFIEFFWEFDGIYISGFGGYSFPFFKNNILSISKNNITIINYVYVYDNDNYPTNVSENSTSGIFDYTIEY